MRNTRKMRIGVIGVLSMAMALITAPLAVTAQADEFDLAGVVDNFDFFQHDFAVSKGAAIASARIYSGSDTGDYWHGQLDLSLSDNLSVGARYADTELIKEYRVHASYDLWERGPLYITPILSYHYFDGGELVDRLMQGRLEHRPEDNLNFGRLGVRVGLSKTYDSGWNVYAYHEPRFTFLGDSDGFDFVETKSEGGFSKDLGALRVGPFIQYVTDGDYDKVWLVAGTRVSAAF